MGRNNSSLHKAKKAKNDEFYTRYEDIEKELVHYKDELFGKTIYCPCDDYRVSNFPKFFKDKFKDLGLKKVISTNYDLGNGAWCWTYDGQKETINELQGDGDYNSPECSSLRDSADLVCTNPPFSKFRDFFKWLDKDKKFLIIGNGNAVACKEIFPLIKDNKMWLGVSSGSMKFKKPDRTTADVNICWFTNIDHKKRPDKLDLCKKYNPKDYPTYDNYNAINVNKIADIPEDYYGVMGVPISFLDKYCPDQFEIIWRGGDIDWAENTCDFYTPPIKSTQDKYKKQDKTWRVQNPYLVEKGNAQVVYQRIFIKRK